MKAEQLGNPAGLEDIKAKSISVSLREVIGRGSVRFGAPLLLFATTLFSPIDAPTRPVNAESKPPAGK